MKQLLTICLASLALVGCGKPVKTQTIIVDQGMSRAEYCRSIGLYKEWDSNDCETFADAYDLDEGSDAYKKKKKAVDNKYAHVVVLKDPAAIKKAKAEEQKRLQAEAKSKRQKEELKKQQAANAKKNAELEKLKKEKAAAEAKSKRQAEELKKQQAANKKKKDEAKKQSSISFTKSSSSSPSKSKPSKNKK